MKSLLSVLLILAACTPVAPAPEPSTVPPPGVMLSVERVSTTTMRLTLDNGSREPIGYNLCTSQLQRRSGAEWMAVRTDEVCTMELRTLQPGFDATFEKRLPAGVPSGEYRYLAGVESPLGTAQKGVASAPFRL